MSCSAVPRDIRLPIAGAIISWRSERPGATPSAAPWQKSGAQCCDSRARRPRIRSTAIRSVATIGMLEHLLAGPDGGALHVRIFDEARATFYQAPARRQAREKKTVTSSLIHMHRPALARLRRVRLIQPNGSDTLASQPSEIDSLPQRIEKFCFDPRGPRLEPKRMAHI